MKKRWMDWKQRYEQFVEKRGFFVIICVCVAVIAASAMLSGRATLTAPPAPTPPPADARSAAELMQETLAQAMAAQATAAPTPQRWQAPLAEMMVLRAFDDTRLQYAPSAGFWSLHDAVDLQCGIGTPVMAMSDGVVIAAAEKGLDGAWVNIDHGGGIEALYAGMQLTAGMQPGDPVRAGQTLGFAGNELLTEQELGPHLHLRVTRGGAAIDPMVLLP